MNQTSFFDGPGPDTLQQEIARLLHDRKQENGATCLACGGRCIEYEKRKIYSTMARAMIQIRAASIAEFGHAEGWLHVVRTVGRGRGMNFGLFRYWGLAVPKPPDLKPSGGYWRLTSRGVEFAIRRLRVRKYARVYNDEVLELHGPEVDIQDALGEKWSWSELMGGTDGPE